MSTVIIVFFIAAIVTALLGLAGLVILINSFITQNKKQMWTGSIITGLTLILIISGLFCGTYNCIRVMHKNCFNKEMKCNDFDKDRCEMMGDDSEMMCMDSTMSGDSCKMTIEKKLIMHDKMDCDHSSKCDKSKCKEKCEHEK